MWVPFWTLFKKEVIRFLKVWMHTVLAPVLISGPPTRCQAVYRCF